MMPLPPRRLTTAFLLLVLGFTLTVIGVAAQQPDATSQGSPEPVVVPQFSIRAVGDYEDQWFDVSMLQGETANLTASIRNSGDVPVVLRTYATNAENPANGGFSAGTDEDEPIGSTRWLDYPEESLELSPGEEHLIDFTVTVPADTRPGEYYAALVVQTDEPLPIPGTEVFQQTIRSTISVEITVPGVMTSGFELGEPVVTRAHDHWILDVPFSNTGTARLRPQGALLVTTGDGDSVSSTDVELGSVYGGTTTSVRIRLPEHLPLGEYLVSLDLTDEATGATASIEDISITLVEPEVELPEAFVVDAVSVTPTGDPVQYAGVAATITNNGSAIPTANVTLNVQRDGEEVERYPLAESRALPQGSIDVSQRYIPVDGWQPGTYTFQFVVSAVNGGTETALATIDIEDEITVP